MWKVSEFGVMVGISPSTLRRWEEEGKLIPERTLVQKSEVRNRKSEVVPTTEVVGLK